MVEDIYKDGTEKCKERHTHNQLRYDRHKAKSFMDKLAEKLSKKYNKKK